MNVNYIILGANKLIWQIITGEKDQNDQHISIRSPYFIVGIKENQARGEL
jgi:hypothetical protein